MRIPVTGMTCAACQARVQRALQRAPGVVDANVNLTMQTAAVTFDANVATAERLVEVIRKTGYGAELARPDETVLEEQRARDAGDAQKYVTLKRKAIVSGAIGAIAMVVSMLPFAMPTDMSAMLVSWRASLRSRIPFEERPNRLSPICAHSVSKC